MSKNIPKHSLQSPAEINTVAVTFIPFHTNYDYEADYHLIKTWFLPQYYIMSSKHFTIVYDL